MDVSDEQLLAFSRLDELEYVDKLHGPDPHPDVERMRELLAKHDEVFRHHLLIALLLEEQADHIEDPSADKAYGKIELRGYKAALRHTIADLRSGEFLPPDGTRYTDRFDIETA